MVFPSVLAVEMSLTQWAAFDPEWLGPTTYCMKRFQVPLEVGFILELHSIPIPPAEIVVLDMPQYVPSIRQRISTGPIDNTKVASGHALQSRFLCSAAPLFFDTRVQFFRVVSLFYPC
jgi:hypothetical protein